MSRSENIPGMTTDKTRGEHIGRKLGERIGRALGQKAGQIIGEWFGRRLDQTDNSAIAADSESDDGEALSSLPETQTELEEMSYRELQSLAKVVGVKANITQKAMIERIVDTLNIDSGEE